MSAVYNLIQSSLRSKRAILTYKALYPNIPRFLTEEDWIFSVEVEAVLRISKDNVILSQHEKKLNAAFGPVARRYAHKKLTSDTLSIINMNVWDGKSKISPRIMMDVNDMSTAGRICRKWAILELERRFFGNDGEEIFDDTMMVDACNEVNQS